MGTPSARVLKTRPPLGTFAVALAATAIDASLLAIALGGVLPLLAHGRALALIAVWGVSTMVLAFLRPVRATALTRVREERLLLAALFLIPLLTPPLSAWGERAGLWLLPGGAALGWLGVTLAALGVWLRIAAMVQLGTRFVPLPAIQLEHALETRGLYGLMRHPGYAGAWLANLGAALAFGSALGLIGVALMSVALVARARPEEAMLEAHFGAAYRAYCERTGRLIPRLRHPRGR